MAINTLEYIKHFLKIRTKEAQIIPLNPNRAQMELYKIIQRQYSEERPIRIVVLKARQLGISTFVGAVFTKLTATEKNISTGIITHKDDATNNLYEMYKTYYHLLPKELKPKELRNNAKELVFDTINKQGLNSRIKCMTATTDGVGRSDTYQYLHISEYAFWKGNKKDILTGLMQAVPDSVNSMVIIESTANGFDEFKELWDEAVAGYESGKSGFYPLFIPWHYGEDYTAEYNGFELTEYETLIKDNYGLTNEQLQWRRNAIVNKCFGDEEKFRQEYPITPEEAFIATGRGVFDNKSIYKRMMSLPRYIFKGDFKFKYTTSRIWNIELENKRNGLLTIYRYPVDRHPYVIGCDTAGEGSDNFIAQVIDNHTGEQVAILELQNGEIEFVRQLYCLGMYYNIAMITIETNFSTYCVNKLEEYDYLRQYVRERKDTYTDRVIEAFGWRTTTVTRPLAIDMLAEIVKEHTDLIVDRGTLEEMLSFVKNEKGKAQALKGKHDDKVMALAIAYASREQFTTLLLEEDEIQKPNKVDWFLDDSDNSEREGIEEWL